MWPRPGSDLNDCLTPATACLTIDQALTLAGAGDTVNVAAGTYAEPTLAVDGERLVGTGAAVTIIEAAGQHTIMGADGNSTISGVTLRNGWASSGGALTNFGTLTIESSVLTGNIGAQTAGAVYNVGSLVLRNSVVSSNTVTATVGFAGGILNAGALTIENSTFTGNPSSHVGALSNTGTAEIYNSTVHANRATGGYTGGLHNQGTLTVTNVTVSGNTATEHGAGMMATAGSSLVVVNSTVAGNTGTGGAGLHLFGGSVRLKNTIVAGNTPANCYIDVSATLTSEGHNLDSGATCSLAATGDLDDTDPLLGPLQNNGGPTLTHALLPGSSAINGGSNSGCPATDQRGYSRPMDGTCDIGAFEWFDFVLLYLPLVRR